MKRVRNGNPKHLGVSKCSTCGKRRYLSRQDAKRAARVLSPSESLRAYQCGEFWHLGHNPAWRVRGEGRG